jgi:hypothetical protein
MVITYVVSPMSYWLGRALINVEHIGLVNLIADRTGSCLNWCSTKSHPRPSAETVHAPSLSDPHVYVRQMCRSYRWFGIDWGNRALRIKWRKSHVRLDGRGRCCLKSANARDDLKWRLIGRAGKLLIDGAVCRVPD